MYINRCKYCIAEKNGLLWPQESEKAFEACPGEPCLRSYGCLIVS